MILPHTPAAIMVLLFLAVFCWGSWANTLKRSKWRFELFYLDFAIGFLLFALIYAFTVGSMGFDGFSFMDDTMHAGKRQWVYVVLAGALFTFANMLITAAISVAGMAVASTVSLGFAVIVGSVVDYIFTKSVSPSLLFGGCALLLCGIIAGASARGALLRIRHEELAKAGNAKSTRRPSAAKGTILALLGGLVMAFFPIVLRRGMGGELGLGPYAASVFLAGGAFISAFAFGIFFINLPVEGDPLEVFDYFKGRPKQHLLGVAGGGLMLTAILLTLVGTVANASVAAGGALEDSVTPVAPAIRYFLGQASPIFAVLWGAFAWKEFEGGDSRVRMLAFLMLLLFAAGVALLAVAQTPVKA